MNEVPELDLPLGHHVLRWILRTKQMTRDEIYQELRTRLAKIYDEDLVSQVRLHADLFARECYALKLGNLQRRNGRNAAYKERVGDRIGADRRIRC